MWADLQETRHVPHLALRVFDGHLCITQRFLYGARPYAEVIAFAEQHQIQVSKDKASLTKPRLKLIKLDTAMMAIIAQSTQVNATVRPAYGKGAAF